MWRKMILLEDHAEEQYAFDYKTRMLKNNQKRKAAEEEEKGK
jgi:hypothetical protein